MTTREEKARRIPCNWEKQKVGCLGEMGFFGGRGLGPLISRCWGQPPKQERSFTAVMPCL